MGKEDQGGQVKVKVPDDLNEFSRDLRIGGRDRGLGRVDYAVIQDGQPIAVLNSTRQGPDGQVVILPDLANARLFAAAPELYDACRSALDLIRARGIECLATIRQIRQLEQVLAAADGRTDETSQDGSE
jgi:hypothetical protein